MVIHFDRPLVIGSGVAGLSVALGLGDCVVITKTRLGAGSSDWAQGGVASAIATDDSPTLHASDTVKVSGGLAVEEAVSLLTRRGPEAIDRLINLGAEFDRNAEGALALGREAGHSRRRIVHANGDATGAEVMRTLVAAIDDRPSVEVFEDHVVVDLVMGSDGSARGVLVVTPSANFEVWVAPSVVIATGGVGQVFARTTNPSVVTGDGIAMAIRAGIRVADMEFVQFHPTALDAGLDPMPLLTEALRGEGAHLVDGDGIRYMLEVHPDAELAPRDVVARANYRNRGDAYLDATLIGESFPSDSPLSLLRQWRSASIHGAPSCRFRRRVTISWAGFPLDRMATRRPEVSMQWERHLQRVSTAPTDSRRTRCSKAWCLVAWSPKQSNRKS